MSPLTPLWDDYPLRIAGARRLMAAQDLDALLLVSGPNLRYFSGMPCGRSGARPFVYVLPRAADPVLLVHEGRQFEARRLSSVADVVTYRRLSHLPIDAIRTVLGSLPAPLVRVGAELGGELVLDAPVGEVDALRAALGDAELVDASALLWRLRTVKSAAEIERIRRACAITAHAYAATFAATRPGMREVDVERMLYANLHQAGGETPWVLTTSGPGNYDLVSKGASDRTIAPGDMIWFDCGCAVDGYWSDFSRAGVVGGPSRQQVEAQAAVQAITSEGIAMVRPGTPVADIAAHCNAAVAGLELPVSSNISALAARVGHGLGMSLSEPPSLAEVDATRLVPGMIVTIEPAVATAFGTFHVEANVLVTEAEPELLSTAPWQLWTI